MRLTRGPCRDGILRYTIIEDAELTDITDECARFVVFGEQATNLILKAFPRANFATSAGLMKLTDDSEIMALRTDAAGVKTWMIVAPRETTQELLSRFENLGHNLANRSLFDYVRITNRVPIAGCELTENVNPLEASMLHLIDFEKGCYVGQEVIARLDTYDKVQRKLVAFNEADDHGENGKIETEDRILASEGGRNIGWVSSVAVDPATGKTFGLAYVRGQYVDGEDIQLTPRGDGTAQLT